MTDNKQRREDAARREEQLREDVQRVAASGQSSGQSPASPEQAGDQRADSPSPTQSNASQAQAVTPTTDVKPSQYQGGRRRNHHRSRRLGKFKKTPVGAPPPELTGEELLDAGESARPLLFPSGIGPGLSGRERERA